MEKITIKVPDGFEINEFNKQTGDLIIIKKSDPQNPMEHITTIDDILEDNNTSMDEIDQMFKSVPEHLKWQYIAELLAKSLNVGWEPDWDDSNQYKYYPWFKMDSSGFRAHDYDGWNATSIVGSRLCFKSKELAEYAGEQFIELYQKFMII